MSKTQCHEQEKKKKGKERKKYTQNKVKGIESKGAGWEKRTIYV